MKNSLWGGRFAEALSERMFAFNESFSFDRELLEQELAASGAWAAALRGVAVLSDDEAAAITNALQEIAAEPLPVETDIEDVHSWVESELRKRVGGLAGKLHTGRSRNDQVATDLRLWIRAMCTETRENLLSLVEALGARAREHAASPMPGYTHLKQAEPVTFGHWCLAYAEMLLRDASRLQDLAARADECPLGSAALAGTPLPIDRESLARDLGFSRPSRNSIDAVSDRDAAAELHFACSLLLVHLSRFAEDVIFYSSDEARFLELPDSLATGSSRMPQKKNPDLLELVRGHAARSIGDVSAILSLLKGLPLAYDKDLQLDKEPLFRLRRTLGLMLPLLTQLVKTLIVDAARMREKASSDLLLATMIADSIAARGVPFREAHDIVSRRIGQAALGRVTLRELGPGESIMQQDLDAADVDRALATHAAVGGTAPARVAAAASDTLNRVAALRESRRGE